MPTEEREQQHGTQSVPGPASGHAAATSAAAVSMRDLLASCAAADAVSKPPSGRGDDIVGAVARQPEQDAA